MGVEVAVTSPTDLLAVDSLGHCGAGSWPS